MSRLGKSAGVNHIESDRVRSVVIWFWLIENERTIGPVSIALVSLIVLRKVGESLAIFDRKGAVRRLFDNAHGRVARRGTIRFDGNKKFNAKSLASASSQTAPTQASTDTRAEFNTT